MTFEWNHIHDYKMPSEKKSTLKIDRIDIKLELTTLNACTVTALMQKSRKTRKIV